ncbi:MAG: acetylornithine aminotransferase [Spirochaeta sp. LUC14_002_19_P3]|nr:MAG: acetylornithine aminotransferase [Spirochaeta sp. LUC14_002_19_P3]
MQAVVKNPPLPRQYGEELLVLERGEGCRLFDRAGRAYLDMGAGIAVNALGYGREDLAVIAASQMKRLIHVSNLFATPPQLALAEKLTAVSIPGSEQFTAVHFGNSGAEANETAIKYARLYARARGRKNAHRLIAFSNGFHGRTMGALSLTANRAYRTAFEPLLPGCEILPFNDSQSLFAHLDGSAAAVIVEPVQGEGGLQQLSAEFADTLNTLCRKYDVLLIADEVQTGLGRCATLFASELTQLSPDIVTLSKPLAGGLPLSAVLIPQKVNELLKPGDHATTFGGGPVTTAVAMKVWDTVSAPNFLSEVKRKGELTASLLREGLEGIPHELRGAGLLRGVRLTDEKYGGPWCAKIISQTREQGVIILKTGADVLRLAPPLIIHNDELKEGIQTLCRVIQANL